MQEEAGPMKRLKFRMLFPFVLVLYLSGCVHSKTLYEESFDTINLVFADGNQIVALHEGRRLKTTGFQIKADSLVWSTPVGDTLLVNKIPVSEVEYIDVIDRGRGALEGLALFGGGGLVIGGLLASVSYEECDNCWFGPDSRSEAASWGALGLGLVGVVVGPIFGAASGSRDRYVLSTDGSVDAFEEAPAVEDKLFGSVAVGDHVRVMRFKSYWPHTYEGVVIRITHRFIVLDIGKGPVRIKRNSIQSIHKISEDIES